METIPVKKEIIKTYWSCGIEKHRHRTRVIAQQCITTSKIKADNKAKMPDVNERNRGIVRFICAGATYSQAAREYKVSVTTVKTSVRNQMRRAMGHYRRNGVTLTVDSISAFYYNSDSADYLYKNKEWLQLILEAYWRSVDRQLPTLPGPA